MNLKKYYCLDDLERAARKRLPRCVFGYIEGGAEDCKSVLANRGAFDHVDLVPRILQDTSARSMSSLLWNDEWSAPFGIAPMGAAGVAGFRADLAMARAAAQENVPFMLSGASLVRMERVCEVNPRLWMQVYPSLVRKDNDALLERALDCGVETIVLTVDVPVSANREQDLRNGYTSPLRPTVRLALDGLRHPRWLCGTFLRTLCAEGMPHFENFAAPRVAMMSATAGRPHQRDRMDWAALLHLRQQWPKRMVLKGVLAAEDACLALQAGIDGVVVSNHGGRQLDGAIPPLKALPRLRSAVPEMPVFYDSGIRRGTDVLKAVALGASMAFVGRPFLYAAAVGGTDLVRHAVQLLKAEISRDMALLGAASLDALPERVQHSFA